MVYTLPLAAGTPFLQSYCYTGWIRLHAGLDSASCAANGFDYQEWTHILPRL